MNKQHTLENQYKELQAQLASGWNTWNATSVLSHVWLPHGLNVQLCINNTFIAGHHYLRESYISSKEQRPEKITPGLHALDGSYTSLQLAFEGSVFQIETASDACQWVMLVTPVALPYKHPHLVLEVGILYNRKGTITLSQNRIEACGEGWQTSIGTTGEVLEDYLPVNVPYLSVASDKAVGFYAGEPMGLEEIRHLIGKQKAAADATVHEYGELSGAFQALHNVIAWNVIYDPFHQRAIFPVSRCWNEFFGGPFVLFDWDTYFGAYMVSLESRELAYANAIAITKHAAPGGFIPNYVGGYGLGSWDRSQPPVGSKVFLELYRKFGDRWVLEYVFDDLLRWNRWWLSNRSHDGYLCWGSDPLPQPNNGDCDNWQAAAYESGLDNSPMYDDVPFNRGLHLMDLADVGLMSLYVMDCESLAAIANILGQAEVQEELEKRAEEFRTALKTMWCEEDGIFLNKRLSDGSFSKKLSPTLFYPLLAGAATPQQAKRMMEEHLMNPNEFYGDWMIPSIAKNDPTYQQQDYWRGRIWPPMNYLVYLALRRAGQREASALVMQKSLKLLMDTWQENQMVHENYNAMSGRGRNKEERMNTSDSYYHWGGLLAFMALTEAGYVPDPWQPQAD